MKRWPTYLYCDGTNLGSVCSPFIFYLNKLTYSGGFLESAGVTNFLFGWGLPHWRVANEHSMDNVNFKTSKPRA